MKRDNVYLESSVFVKLLIDEPDTTAFRAAIWPRVNRFTTGGTPIFDSIPQIFISQLTQTEFISAIYKKVRTTDITYDQAEIIFNAFDLEFVGFIPISDTTLLLANQLIHKYNSPSIKLGLRTLDAIQLASALQQKEELDRYFVADEQLLKAFIQEGLNVIQP
jgi:uncharacterized protein